MTATSRLSSAIGTPSGARSTRHTTTSFGSGAVRKRAHCGRGSEASILARAAPTMAAWRSTGVWSRPGATYKDRETHSRVIRERASRGVSGGGRPGAAGATLVWVTCCTFLALTTRSANVVATSPAHRRRVGGRCIRLEHGQRHAGALLRRCGPEHGRELAQLFLRRCRSVGNRLGRQAPGRTVDSSPVTTRLRIPRVGHRVAASRRGHPYGARALPGGVSRGRARCRTGERGRSGREPSGASPQPGQHLRLAPHSAPRAGRRCHHQGDRRRRAPTTPHGRSMGGSRLSGENGAGLVGASCSVPWRTSLQRALLACSDGAGTSLSPLSSWVSSLSAG